jgi:replicative DNA helicase
VGLHNGHLIVIGGRPSHGKTALSMNFVEHVAVNLKKPVAVFSLEMSQQQLAVRMLCSRSGVSRRKLESGNAHRTGKISNLACDRRTFRRADFRG